MVRTHLGAKTVEPGFSRFHVGISCFRPLREQSTQRTMTMWSNRNSPLLHLPQPHTLKPILILSLYRLLAINLIVSPLLRHHHHLHSLEGLSPPVAPIEIRGLAGTSAASKVQKSSIQAGRDEQPLGTTWRWGVAGDGRVPVTARCSCEVDPVRCTFIL